MCLSKNNNDNLNSILSQIKGLDLGLKESIKEYVVNMIFEEKNTYPELIKTNKRTECPHCKSDLNEKNGKSKLGLQRYRCKNDTCRRYFSDSTGQSIHWIHKKNLWYAYIDYLFGNNKDITLRHMSKTLNISYKTAFAWRHKILYGLYLEKDTFKGIVEVDDVHYKINRKGERDLLEPKKRGNGYNKPGDNHESVKVLIAIDRISNSKFDLATIGRLKKVDVSRILHGYFTPEKNIITADKHPSIKAFAKSEKITIETFGAKSHVRGIYHVNTLNQEVGELNNLIIGQFKGVSTKYLQNYLNFFKAIKLKKTSNLDVFSESFTSVDSWFNYRNRYANFNKWLHDVCGHVL